MKKLIKLKLYIKVFNPKGKTSLNVTLLLFISTTLGLV